MDNLRSISEEREKLLNKVYIESKKDKEKAIRLLEKLREQYDWAIPGYRNSLRILSDTTYENRKHFLLELIQNADDADFNNVVPEITFKIDNDKFIIKYNEIGFSVDDIISITDTGNSTKCKDKGATSFIGEKGIGFKSVFALADRIDIRSGEWNFSLYSDKCIIPRLLDCQKTLGTELIIYFKDKDSLQIIKEELENYFIKQTETFLFLQKIKMFNFKHNGNCLNVSICHSDKDNSITIHKESNSKEYLQYCENIIFPKELAQMRWENMNWDKDLVRKVSIVAPVKEGNNDIQGLLFCYLPTKVNIPIPLYIQIDAQMKADREKLHDPYNNEWNKFLLSKLPNVIINAIESFKNTKISNNIINFIPNECGNDQLKDVISELQKKLKDYDWIKTNDNTWVKPQDAIVPTDFLLGVIKEDDNYRQKIEKLLNKKFIYFDWYSKQYYNVLDKYEIHKISSDEFSFILSQCGYPIEKLKNNNLLSDLYDELYNILRRLPSFAFYKNNNRKIQENIKCSPIFPIENEGFSDISTRNGISVFWISSKSKKEIGLGKLTSGLCRIINPEYTYMPNTNSKDLNEDTFEKNKKIKENNQSLINLLQYLNIEELSSDNVLSKIQIPAMLNNIDDISLNMKMLINIYNNYRLKKNFDNQYLNDLYEIRKVQFITNNFQNLPLEDVLLPQELRIKQQDNLYDCLNLPSLLLDRNTLKDIISKSDGKEKFREFLCKCGILNKCRFEICTKEISRIEFSESKAINEYDKNCILNNCTKNRNIVIEECILDKYTMKLLDCKRNLNELSKQIYQLWKNNFSDFYFEFCNEKHLDYNLPEFGYAGVKHIYRGRKYSNAHINNWGGCSREDIPLIGVNGQITYSNKAKFICSEDIYVCNKLTNTLKLIDIVISGSKYYVKEYLDSLEVKEICLDDLVQIWESNKKISYESILLAAIELINAGISYNNFRIFDKNEKELIPAEKFKMGNDDSEYKYSIEEQYGEIGRKIGILLNLEQASKVSKFLNVFERFSDSPNKDLLHKIYLILKNWSSWSIEDKYAIKQSFDNAFSNKDVVLLFENEVNEYKLSTESIIINLKIDNFLEKINLETAAREIGILLIDSSKNIEPVNERQLDVSEKQNFNEILSKYSDSLTEKDLRLLVQALTNYGGIEGVANRIIKVEKIYSKIGNIKINLSLPLLNKDKGKIYINTSADNVEIISLLLNSIGFERYNTIKKYLHEINNNIVKDKENQKTVSYIDAESEVEKQLQAKISESVDLKEIDWNIGMYPEEEEELRETTKNNLEQSFENSFEIKKINRRNETKHRNTLKNDTKIVDKNSIDAKEYLLNQYDGKCQVCHNEIKLSNNKKFIMVYHIVKKGHWINREYNILGLCPNCYVKALFGEYDLSNIIKYSKLLEDGDIFPEASDEFNGDYYFVPIEQNGKKYNMVFSKDHFNKFCAFFAAKIEKK